MTDHEREGASMGSDDPSRPSGTMTRIARWDTMRFWLMVLVIAGHFLQQLNGAHGDAIPSATVQIALVYSFHMPAFFLISGMLARGALASDRFPSRRVVSYALAGFIAELGQRLMEAAGGNGFEFHLVHSMDISWFMTALIIHTMLTWLLRDADRRKLLLVSILLGCLIGYDKNVGDLFSLSLVLTNWPFYVLGTMHDADDVDRRIAATPHARAYGIAWFVVLAVLFSLRVDVTGMLTKVYLWQNYPFEDSSLIPLLWRILVYGSSLGGCLAFAAIMPAGEMRVATEFGRRTMAPYCLHWPILLACIWGGLFFALPDVLGIAGAEVACWLIGLALTLVLSLPPFWPFVRWFSRA